MLVNIRKFTGVPLRSLDELVELGAVEPAVAGFLAACMKARASVVFAGAPGAGKTTLLSCCLAELEPSLRVVVAEEVFEADIALPNVAQMQTRPARADRPEVDLRRLVAGFLRMAPDVAVVGEVRDREALSLLLALSSGVTGYTTIHASSAAQALSRLRFLSQLSEAGRHLPFPALSSLVSDAIDVVVHSARTREGVRITSVVAVEDLVSGPESPHFTLTEVFAAGRATRSHAVDGRSSRTPPATVRRARPRGADSPVGRRSMSRSQLAPRAHRLPGRLRRAPRRTRAWRFAGTA